MTPRILIAEITRIDGPDSHRPIFRLHPLILADLKRLSNDMEAN